MGKKPSQVKRPSSVIFANEFPFAVYWLDYNPFSTWYWHNRTELGWGNVLFVDGHVSYLHATNWNPNWYSGEGWTFIYDG